MAVPSSALKALGIGVVAIPTVSLGVVYKDKIGEGLGIISREKIDEKLIEILREDNKDIVFEVKDGNGNLSDISFPNDNKTLSKTITVSIKISSDEADKSRFFKVSGGDATETINNLKKLNGGKNWTWECKINLIRDKHSVNINEIYNKEKLKDASGNTGFFDILQKDLTANQTNDDKKRHKNTKIQFIKNCASLEPYEKITRDSLAREKKFNLKTKTANIDEITWAEISTSESKLYFPNPVDFNGWFVTPTKLTKWDIHMIELAEKGDVQFNVGNTLGNANSFNFEGDSTSPQVEISYLVPKDKSTEDLNKESGSESKKDWTWKCVIKFTRKTNVTEKGFRDKEQLDEFLEKLKLEGSREKNLKIRFIENCANSSATPPTNLTGDAIARDKTFSLVAGLGNLVPDYESEFNYWTGK